MGFLFRPSSVDLACMTALDAVSTSLMLADAEMRITYMNAAAMTLMNEAADDLRLALPNFNAGSIIGSSMDIFSPDLLRRRREIESMQQPHHAFLHFGCRSFDLVVVPVLRGNSTTGFVIEWRDAGARLLNDDYAANIAALHRSNAVIEFASDGTILKANKIFLKALGYSERDVVGKHHSMFIQASGVGHRDYKLFWERLRAGEFQAGQFKRIGKGGREVWIDGSYNPIPGADGKVVRVVKFATDVTAQVNLLTSLKLLIDTNFGEVDDAIRLSSNEAHAAARAAEDTSSNVSMVAASAEELAASIGEIAQSMSKSRMATEDAFAQTVAVAKSTETLATAAQAMTGIVGLIRNVASQINLLALNATIEAARAGDAGKGFAVVASEVKNLAIQAAKATEQISTEIDGIQATSTDVVNALGAIRDAVTTVRESVLLTASAIEEQSSVTQSMSSNMQSASCAVSTVTASIGEISSAVIQVAAAVARTKDAANVLVR